MRVAGIMSGTSLDGIDVAIVDLRGTRIETVAFHSIAYPQRVRAALLNLSAIADLSRMNFLLGELYAEAVRETCRRGRVALSSLELIGMHGQTVFHEGAPSGYLGRRIASTLQIGEPAVVAERTGVRVISHFRERDIAAGGQGAPLVPALDYHLYRHRRLCRVALNIGGIANVTVIPPRAQPGQVIALDTGPGNMVIDALVERHTRGRQNFDRGGRIARAGRVDQTLVQILMRHPFVRARAPKTAGREQFGAAFVDSLLATGIPLPDLIATATEFTARSIADQIRRAAKPDEIVVSGGGVHNVWLMQRLRELCAPALVVTSAVFGIHPDAKEAVAFAVLAYRTAKGAPGNLPSATGARRAAVLGQITPR